MKAAGAVWNHPNSSNNGFEPFVILPCGDTLLLAMGSGSETGWDLSYRVSQVVLNRMADYLCEAHESASQAIEAAFVVGLQALTQEFPANLPDDDASCTVLCAIFRDNQTFIGWEGGEEAYHVREGSIIAHTRGHIIGNVRADVTIPTDHPFYNIATRFISENSEDQPELLADPWHLIPGDNIVFVNNLILRQIEPEQIPQIISGKTPSQAAQSLVDTAINSERKNGIAAVVVQLSAD